MLGKDRPICRLCAADWHIWEPWPETEAEKLSARERRRSCFRSQIVRLGNRLRACVQLLLDYTCTDPPTSFPQFDDPHLWSGIDLLLETFFRFFYPLTVCERTNSPSERAVPTSTSTGELSHPLSRPVFSSFGEICDMLLEHAGYEGRGPTNGLRGQDRLIRLIAEHPDLSSFEKGEFYDVDSELEKLLLQTPSTY
ncbi:hypothetical protein GGR51DRAFT_525689, partial [Nemania sp. FL0031]